MNKEQKWIEKHPIIWFLMQKIGDFLWFFAKFSNGLHRPDGGNPKTILLEKGKFLAGAV